MSTRCIICDGTEWQNVDEYRLKPSGMHMCKACGFCTYPDKLKSEEELIKYYRKDYRSKPTFENFAAGQRKLHYHHAFLKDVWVDMKKRGVNAPVIGEIGAAHGMFLNYVKEQFMDAELFGTELTLSFRRCAFNEFGLNLTEKLDLTKQYDLIATYKVAEHQMDADKRLREYTLALKPDGLIYIGVPTWFGRLHNFGLGGFDIEYYYSTNHINVWTKDQFEFMLKKCGLEVLKYNGTMYDDVYLCKRNDALMGQAAAFDPKLTLQNLAKVYNANLAFLEQDWDKAIGYWQDFPIAHIHRYEHRRQKFHALGIEGIEKEVMDFAINACPESSEIYAFCGEVYMRYAKYGDAIRCFENSIRLRPGFSPAIRSIAQCLRQMAEIKRSENEFEEMIDLYKQARELTKYLALISKQDEAYCMTWIYSDNSKIPTKDEIIEKTLPA
jgi:SAM-dependent methyltransferase